MTVYMCLNSLAIDPLKESNLEIYMKYQAFNLLHIYFFETPPK